MSTNNPLARPRALGQRLVFAASATTAMCQEMLAPHGLTLAHWVILSALWRRDGMLVTELADYTGNNAPATSRIIDRMSEKGLVTREPDTADRRAIRVRLTERGRSLDHLRDFYRQVNDRLLAGIGDKDAARLFDLLEQVERNARAEP